MHLVSNRTPRRLFLEGTVLPKLFFNVVQYCGGGSEDKQILLFNRCYVLASIRVL